MSLDPISHDYIALAHGIDRQVPGFIDAYAGPPEMRARFAEAEPATPLGLLEQAQALAGQVAESDYPERRKAYLTAQVQAMVAVCRQLTGEMLSYADEVRGCFDVEPARTPEAVFEAAISELDGLLPGQGDVRERMMAWRQRFEVSPETARVLIDVIVPEIRRRTAAFVDLPQGEEVEFRLVSDKPWNGYNWYLGNARSRVEINTDLPIRANALTGLVCHEAYPGHHTEHSLKERRLYQERGWGEHAIQLISTPQAVISEGIATLAETIVFPAGELHAWQAERLYPVAGLSGDPEREAGIDAAQRALRAVNANAALLLHAGHVSEDDVLAYLMRYGQRDEAEARQSLRFIDDPLWRAYVFTYHAGRDLLARWLDGGDRLSRFRTLLTEQVSPSLVMEWLAGEDSPEPSPEAVPSPS
ncbi:MAG TPA: hypothetical protein VGR16_05315 [Thermomicrobiales bacterium]|nr:hypothetical protein [Thermomicrobiales bacterium]